MAVLESRSARAVGRLGDPLLDRYLEFVESRCRLLDGVKRSRSGGNRLCSAMDSLGLQFGVAVSGVIDDGDIDHGNERLG